VDGVLVVDKPQGLTSHDVVAAARRALRERRIGHTGTLDPMATGVLALACGRATRLVRFLTAADKDYDAAIRFGITTDTYDATGTETSRTTFRPQREDVLRGLSSLTGEYLQMPPAYSAKKVGGRRAYEMARREEPVELTPAPVAVPRAELVDFDGETARIALTCSAGFYVRSFAHRLGELAGGGACLWELRRTRSGEFTLADAVSLEDLAGGTSMLGRLRPLERLLGGFPAVTVSPAEHRRVSHGQDVPCPASWGDEPESGRADWVRLTDAEGRLLAVATPRPGGDSLHPVVVLI
jgi:tRNA pseudouridine55 synthase